MVYLWFIYATLIYKFCGILTRLHKKNSVLIIIDSWDVLEKT